MLPTTSTIEQKVRQLGDTKVEKCDTDAFSSLNSAACFRNGDVLNHDKTYDI